MWHILLSPFTSPYSSGFAGEPLVGRTITDKHFIFLCQRHYRIEISIASVLSQKTGRHELLRKTVRVASPHGGRVLLFQFFEDVGSGEISYFFFWVLGCCRTETCPIRSSASTAPSNKLSLIKLLKRAIAIATRAFGAATTPLITFIGYLFLLSAGRGFYHILSFTALSFMITQQRSQKSLINQGS